jgi:DNA-binding GntR family transcriptional regulator
VELEAIGMVQFVHNRGAVVKPFGPEALREIYHLRRILECEATRTACGRIDPAPLEDVKRQMQALAGRRDGQDWSARSMASDRRLHGLIAESCGNTRLADEIRRYDTLVQTSREVVGNQLEAQRRALAEHVPIIDALLDRDAERAAQLMARHIDSSAEAVGRVMFGRQAAED